MFRQVVVYQWAEGVSPEAKQAFRDALDGMRAIPELLAMTCGDDAGHFDDNFDFVVVEPAWDPRRLRTLEARMESWTRSDRHRSGIRLS